MSNHKRKDRIQNDYIREIFVQQPLRKNNNPTINLYDLFGHYFRLCCFSLWFILLHFWSIIGDVCFNNYTTRLLSLLWFPYCTDLFTLLPCFACMQCRKHR